MSGERGWPIAVELADDADNPAIDRRRALWWVRLSARCL